MSGTSDRSDPCVPVLASGRDAAVEHCAPASAVARRLRAFVLPILAVAMVVAAPYAQADVPRSGAPVADSRSDLRELPALFDDIEKRTFLFFWETSNPINGLTPDRYPSRPFASIAGMGFTLTAYPIGVENGWVTRGDAAARTLLTLKTFRDASSGPEPTGHGGHRGFFYHFLDMDKAQRFGSWVELSSVDTSLLMMGVLFAQSYYDRDDATENEIRAIAEQLYRKVDWSYLQVRAPLVGMGWYPDKPAAERFIPGDWVGYNEAMLVYVLALASPTHPIPADAWKQWTRSYDKSWGSFHGQTYLAFGPLFGHQYSHVWIDFRGIRDAPMRKRGFDYFENSRRATYAHRAYAIANPMGWKDYGENVWGLSASDGPQKHHATFAGETREFRDYSARGVGLTDSFDDGTIAPTAAIGSLPFAPEIVIPATLEMHRRYGDIIYAQYGFLDAFNPSFSWDVPLWTGRVVPGRGWVGGDYLAIDQGPILTMIANYRNDFVWNVMKRNPHIRKGLRRAGFSGGWLDAKADAHARDEAVAH
jgi:hypothetical protein